MIAYISVELSVVLILVYVLQNEVKSVDTELKGQEIQFGQSLEAMEEDSTPTDTTQNSSKKKSKTHSFFDSPANGCWSLLCSVETMIIMLLMRLLHYSMIFRIITSSC